MEPEEVHGKEEEVQGQGETGEGSEVIRQEPPSLPSRPSRPSLPSHPSPPSLPSLPSLPSRPLPSLQDRTLFQQGQSQEQEWEDDSSEQIQHHQSSASQGGPGEGKLGCEHYQRNCEVEAPCCKVFYGCKLCHDDKYSGPNSPGCKTERMEFDKVQLLRCLKCHQVQPPSQKCANPDCEVTFGQYTCLKCRLYENTPSKVDDIFHCDDCGMCRRGKRENYFHCRVCGYCRPMCEKDNHRCSEDSGMAQCPICLEVLKFSTKYYIALPCGHLIHNQCLNKLRAINCPLCGMAMQKMGRQENAEMEAMIEATRDNLPKEVRGKKVDVLCNECLARTKDAPFHFLGIKCQSCGTFNTKIM